MERIIRVASSFKERAVDTDQFNWCIVLDCWKIVIWHIYEYYFIINLKVVRLVSLMSISPQAY